MQGIVVQGPVDYYKEIVECFKDIPNVVVSTWEDELPFNIEYIQKSGLEVIVSKKPPFPGRTNINYQTTSTFRGIEYLIKKGVTEILKTRGDIFINDVQKLMSVLKGKRMSFLQMCKEGARPLYYNFVYDHFSHDYPADVIRAGFNYLIEELHHIPSEALIAYNILSYMNIDFMLNYEHLKKNNIDFFLQDCVDNNIDLYWLKRKFSIVQATKDKNFYEY